MLHARFVLYSVSAICELAGVGLVILQYHKAQGRWLAHTRAVAEERRHMAADLRFRFDPLVARYGITPGEIRRATDGIETLMVPDRRGQAATVALLVVGIVVGTSANLLSA